MKKILLLACIIHSSVLFSQSKIDANSIKEKMQWFANAKLGIFIHEGIYAVNGIDESWSFYNKKISYADYMKQLQGFTLNNYNPAQWAELIEYSGAKYAVITTKHHDGVAMYNTQFSKLNIVQSTPAKKDMIALLFDELRKRNIKCGAYFSLLDWSHPDYPGFIKDSNKYKLSDDYERWNRFRSFSQGQIKEMHIYSIRICGGLMATGNIVQNNGNQKK